MIKLLVGLGLALSGEWALARDFSGHWNGRGKAIFYPAAPEPSQTRRCSQLELRLEQTKKSLKILSGYYSCEDLQAEYGSAVFEIRGSELYLAGKSVGTLAADQARIVYQDPEDGIWFHLTLSRTESGLDYREEWVEQGELRFLVSGELSAF